MVYEEGASWDGRFTAVVEQRKKEWKAEAQVAAAELLEDVVEVDEGGWEEVGGEVMMFEMDGCEGEMDRGIVLRDLNMSKSVK